MTTPPVADRSTHVLRTPAAGALVIRGSVARIAGFGAASVLGAVTSVFLLRGLGVDRYGQYATVAAVLAITSALSDAGLMAVGLREVALADGPEQERRLLQNLVALRILLSLAAVAAGTAFTIAVGYPGVLVAGTVIGGLGVALVNTQATAMIPLSVELRVGSVTLVEVAKSAATLLAVAALAIAGASLLPYFAVQIFVGAVAVALTPKLVGSLRSMVPSITKAEALPLLREAAPLAVGLALNVLYLRMLVVMMSLQASKHATGLYGTAFRVVELFVGIPPIVVGIAIPVLAVAAGEDLERLSYGVQRLTEAVLVGALGFALIVATLAEPTLRLLGGAKYVGAASMLQIQIWALVPLSVSSVLSVALLARRQQRAIAAANAVALAVVLGLGWFLIHEHGGKGAATAGLVAECALLLALVVVTLKTGPGLLPRLGFLPRPLLALGAGLLTLLLHLPHWVDGAVAGTVFVVAALLVGAVPPEIVTALRRRAPGDST